jgi:tetratricopeptide (TPR) repeat protein
MFAGWMLLMLYLSHAALFIVHSNSAFNQADAMSDRVSRIRFLQAETLFPDESHFRFTHSMGEASLPWNSITHAFLVRWSRDHYGSVPLLVLACGISDYLYYVDGNTMTYRAAEQEETTEGQESASQEQNASGARLSEDDAFRKALEEICSHFAGTCTDRPLAAFLKGDESSIPEFRSENDIVGYCMKLMSGSARAAVEDSAASFAQGDIKKGMLIEKRFTVIDVTASGAEMAYKVLDPDWQVPFLIRALAPEYRSDPGVRDAYVGQARLQVLAGGHRNLVKAELLKDIEGCPCIFTEFVEGRNLEALTSREMLSVKSAMEMGIQLCEGLEHIYRMAGAAHGDIRPFNCIITEDSVLRIRNYRQSALMDAIASKAGGSSQAGAGADAINGLQELERLSYMAPELFDDPGAAAEASDIYSVGVTMYQLLTGYNPFKAAQPSAIMDNHRSLVPPAPRRRNPAVPEELSQLVMKCIEKDSRNRMSDLFVLRSELLEIYREYTGGDYDVPALEKSMDCDCLINEAIVLRSSGREEKAIEAIDRAIDLGPASLRAHFQRGPETSGKAGLDEAGRNALQLTWKGDNLRESSQYEEALRCFEQALGLCSDAGIIWAVTGRTLTAAERFQDALHCFDKALSMNPRAAEIWDWKSDLLIKMHRFREAYECSDESLRFAPGFKWPLYHKGLSSMKLGRFREAVDLFHSAISADERFYDAWIGTGNCQRELGRSDDALQAYQSAIDIEPGRLEAWHLSLRTLKELNRWEEALQTVDKAAGRAVEKSGLDADRAEILFRLGNYAESRRISERNIRQDPDNVNCRLMLNAASEYEKEQKAIMGEIFSVPRVPIESINKDLNTLLSIFCSVKDAISHLKRCSTGGGQTSFLLAALHYLDGDYDAALTSCSKALGDSQVKERAEKLKGSIMSSMSGKAPADPGKKNIFQIAKSLLKKEVDSADDMVMRGFERIKGGNMTDVRAYLREVLGKNPSMYSFVYLIALSYEIDMNTEKAQHYYNELARLVPLSIGIWERKLASRSDSDPNELEQAYRNLIGSYPYIFSIWMEYFRFLTIQRDDTKLTLLASALLGDDFREWDNLQQSPQLLSFKGFLNLYLGRYAQAQGLFEKAISIDSGNSAALAGIARCLAGRRLLDEAFEHLKVMLADEKTHALACYLMADIFIRERQEMKALGTLDEALLKYPDYLPFMYQKARVYFNLKMYPDLDELCGRMLEQDPSFAPAAVLRNNSLAERGQPDAAVAGMTDLSPRSKGKGAARENLGWTLIAMKRCREAISILKGAAEGRPLCRDAYLGSGICCYLDREYDKACDYFQKALELNPGDPYLWMYLGAALFHLGSHQMSESCWDNALSLKSGFFDGWLNKAAFLLSTGDCAKAEECADIALAMSTDDEYALLLKRKCGQGGNVDGAGETDGGGDPFRLPHRRPLSLIEPFHLFDLMSFPSLKAVEIEPFLDPTLGDQGS